MTLRDHRKNVLDVPLAEISKRAGLSIPTLSFYERGMKPRPKHLPLLAKGYRLTVEKVQELLRGESQ